MLGVYKKKCNEFPQQGFQINRGNPICRGLSFVQVGNNHPQFANINGATCRTTSRGKEKVFVNASAQCLQATNRLVNPNYCTLFSLSYTNSNGFDQALLCLANTTTTSNNTVLLYMPSELPAMYRESLDSAAQAAGATTLTLGKFAAITGRIIGVSYCDVWLNGVLASSDTSTIPTLPAMPIALVGEYYSFGVPNTAYCLEGSVALSLIWNRPLHPNEIRSISANPYQIFLNSKAPYFNTLASGLVVPSKNLLGIGF